MNCYPSRFLTIISLVSLLAVVFGLPGIPAAQAVADAEAYVTTITVNSGTDPDVSNSNTCVSHTPCTLRRAIVQARALSAAQRPALIAFNIPTTSAEGYDSSLQIWKININTSLIDTYIFRRLNGKITIDGNTQPGGRATGPKIFIVGPGTGQKSGLVVGDVASNDQNVIRGLGFQNLKTFLFLNTNANTIEQNWFGLSDDGTQPALRAAGAQDGSGNTGIAFGSDAANNIVQGNVFTGLDGVAANVLGSGNVFSNNFIGTTAGGTVPAKQTTASLICTPVDWLGGSGISVAGNGNTIENNIFAGLRNEIVAPSIQPDAIRLQSDQHIVRNNKIGIDNNNTPVGVCGRGIYIIGGPQNNQVSNNQIADSGYSAISLNDILYNGNTLRGNLISKSSAWTQLDGMPNAEDAIQISQSLPDAFEAFQPASVVSIQDTTVTGTSGASSLCPNCMIELFLDDQDGVAETLQSLGTVTANSSGNWTAILPHALVSGQGLRTTSTTAQYNTIAGMSAGTTTRLSQLYLPAQGIFLPMVLNH